MTKVTLISGGQRGIGLGVARALRAEGHRIAIVSEVSPDHRDVTKAIEELGGDALYFQHDLANSAELDPVIDKIEKHAGAITGLVSNAGIGAPVRGDLLELTPENWDMVLAVNLRGAFFLAQAVARRMLAEPEREGRGLVFVTSVSAEMVSPDRAEYCVSKAGASMVARLFAARLAASGIGVFEVRPGIIDTEMTAPVHEKYNALIGNGLVPAGRWGTPADIGAAIVPLLSGAMGFATGSVLTLDGGLSIARL